MTSTSEEEPSSLTLEPSSIYAHLQTTVHTEVEDPKPYNDEELSLEVV